VDDERRAAGLVRLDRGRRADPGCRAVISMWVSPDRRGSGTAQALWGALAGWARKDGAIALSLSVSEGNERA